MRTMRAWIVRVAAQLGLRPRARELDDEIASHVQLHTDENIRAGMPPTEARRAALLALGSQGVLRDDYLNRAGVPVARVLADAGREGFRNLVRHGGFSLAVIGILSLGVGATATLASLVDTLLFRAPPHVLEPERLVEVIGAPNYALFQEVERQSRTLDVSAVTDRALTLGAGDTARSIDTQCVTSSYFRVVGAKPVAGRAFLSEEDVRGGPLTAILSYRVWRGEFDGDPAIVGRVVAIAGRPHQVIGVTPPDFRGLRLAPVDAWILLAVSPELCSFTGQNLLDSISGAWLTTVGRLRDGVEIEQAEAEIRTLALHALRAPGSDPTRRGLEPLQSERSRSRDTRLAVWLAAGAGLILAIACANVAGLLAVRAIDRRREVAVRFQLGASRTRVFVQLVAENVTLAAGCAVGAWVVSAAMTHALQTFFPVLSGDTWFDGRALAVIAVFALGAGLIAGLVPAMQATRARAVTDWRVGRELGRGRAYGRDALVVVQMALALVLVSGASLFGASVKQAKSDLGYELDRVLVVTPDLDRSGIRRQAEKRRVFDEMLERVRALGGIEAASLSSAAPLGSGQFSVVMPGGGVGRGGLTRSVAFVSPDYFRTLGTRILAGRPFTVADGPSAQPVAIVDSALAREMWPGEPVVGQCKPLAPDRPCIEIVGLSEPRRIGSLTDRGGEIFYPLAQSGSAVPQALLLRPAGRARDAIPTVMAAIRQVSPALPLVMVRSLEDLADVKARSWRLGTMLFGLFGAVAIVLAAVGLYASLAFAIRQRTAEIGVRMALGATPGQVARLTLSQGARLLGVGWALGLAGSLLFAGSIKSLLFGVAPTHPLTLFVASVAILIAGTAGCLLPVMRAARIDPIAALRAE